MEQDVNNLVEILKKYKQEFIDAHKLAFMKFKKWHAFIKKIIQESGRNPNIIAMAFTQKLLAYSGVIESLNLGNSPGEKFEQFFSLLDEHEKFLVMMAVKLGKIDTEIELGEEGAVSIKKESERKQREERIVDAYLKNSYEEFDRLFRETINNKARDTLGLYNLRSRLVHQGEFVLAMISDQGDILSYFVPGKLRIDERVISLDEMFLRGFCGIVKINAPSLISRVKNFLIENRYSTKTPEYLQLMQEKFKGPS